jgi:hypothetical protein
MKMIRFNLLLSFAHISVLGESNKYNLNYASIYIYLVAYIA